MHITGNMMMSFASNLSSGYWDILDTRNMPITPLQLMLKDAAR